MVCCNFLLRKKKPLPFPVTFGPQLKSILFQPIQNRPVVDPSCFADSDLADAMRGVLEGLQNLREELVPARGANDVGADKLKGD